MFQDNLSVTSLGVKQPKKNGKSQKSVDLIHTAAEAWNHAEIQTVFFCEGETQLRQESDVTPTRPKHIHSHKPSHIWVSLKQTFTALIIGEIPYYGEREIKVGFLWHIHKQRIILVKGSVAGISDDSPVLTSSSQLSLCPRGRQQWNTF
jgi:hypothetical protein